MFILSISEFVRLVKGLEPAMGHFHLFGETTDTGDKRDFSHVELAKAHSTALTDAGPGLKPCDHTSQGVYQIGDV